MLAPIVLFTYNRPEHTEKVLRHLGQCRLTKESTLIIYQDGAKINSNQKEIDSWNAVNHIIKSIDGFKEIIIRVSEQNLGCDPSMLKGITEVVNEYGKVIVLEDDLVVSAAFLEYMNFGLDYFEDHDDVGAINAYSYNFQGNLPPYFFIKGVNPYGWATWKKYWDLYEYDSQKLIDGLQDKNAIEDWDFGGTYDILKATLDPQYDGGRDVKWYASLYLNNKLGLFPSHSFVTNIGFDNSGTHTNNMDSRILDAQFKVEELNDSFDSNLVQQVEIIENTPAKKLLKRKYLDLYRPRPTLRDQFYILRQKVLKNIKK